MQRVIWFRLLLLMCIALLPAYSEGSTLRAQVATDTDVYAQPNFNSRKIEHLQSGTVVYMKTEKFIGTGGMGVFFKIKTPSGKIGYITDSDLLAPSAEQPLKPIAVPGTVPPPSEFSRPAKKEGVSTLWGLSVGLVNYAEKIEGVKYEKQHIFFGARRTGAAKGIRDWRTDAGLVLAPGAPKFLADAGAYGSTTGFIMLTDFLFLKPFFASDKYMFFGAAGPLIALSNYKTNIGSGAYNESSIRPGLVLDGGFALHFSGNALRFDLKYIIEKTMYLSEMVTLQMAF